MQCKVTPEMFWQFRRAQLGGKSAVTGAPLPQTLAECNPDVQADHYAQACYAMAHYEIATRPIESFSIMSESLSIVPVPAGISKERAEKIRRDVIGQMFTDHGVG